MKTEKEIKEELKVVKAEQREAIKKKDWAEAQYLEGVIMGIKVVLELS